MSENNGGSVKLGTVRIEKEVVDGKLVFTFNSVTKGADGKADEKVELVRWSGLVIADVPASVKEKALGHGFLQKYGDALAGKKEWTIDEATDILDDMAVNHMNNDWNKPGRTKKEKGAEKVTETAALATLAELRNGPQGAMFASMSDEAAIALMRQFGMLK
jgi:hypothetical protein